MKGFWGLVGTLTVTIIGGLLVAAFQKPIERWVQGGGLRAELIAGPWVPYPDQGKLPESEEKWSDQDRNGFAVLLIQNAGEEVVTNARIRFGTSYNQPDVYVPASGDNPPLFTKDAKEVSLPDLKPGEQVNLYLWEKYGFGWPSFTDNWSTYSSAGPISISLSVHPVDGYTYSSDNIYLLILDNLWFIFCVILTIFMFIFVIGYYAISSYSKKLLKDQSFYLVEAGRFEQDGEKKFQPKWEA